MSERANVTAVDAIEAFRSQLIVYLSKAQPALEEVGSDVLRTRLWLENEQRTRWENELRRRRRELEQAQQALFSARISNLREERAAEVQAVHRCRRALDEAEEKLKTLKRWDRDFESRVLPLVKQIEKLQTLFAHDLPQGIAHLAQIVRALQAYAEVKPSESVSGADASAAHGGASSGTVPA